MKMMRKMMAAIMALVMILSLSITAFAENPTDGTLTITGDQLAGKKVTISQMFTANVLSDDDYIGEGDSVGYELVPAWQEFIDAQLGMADDANATSEDAYNFIKDLSGDALYAFAEATKNYAKANETIVKQEATAAEVTNTATFTNLSAGYYIVYPEMGSTSVNRKTDAMLVNVPSALSGALNMNLKTNYPTVEKKVEGVEDVSAMIGGIVDFTLISAVPEMSDYTDYAFTFVDTMSAGLEYVADSVSVTIGNDEIDASNYLVEYDAEANKLTVAFYQLNEVAGIVPGEEIVVSYQATLTADALIGDPNPNKAHVEYITDPNWEFVDEDNDKKPDEEPKTDDSDKDDADVYTFEIVIDKYAFDNPATKLPGAVFTLKDTTSTPIELVVVDAETNTYRVATTEDTEKVTQVTTNADGAVTINGLAEGTYYLSEVTAPTGYNKLAEDVTIVIAADYEQTSVEVTYQVDDDAATTSSTIPVENKTGTVLPETGAMGTIGLTIFGVMVVILGIALPRKKNVRA